MLRVLIAWWGGGVTLLSRIVGTRIIRGSRLTVRLSLRCGAHMSVRRRGGLIVRRLSDKKWVFEASGYLQVRHAPVCWTTGLQMSPTPLTLPCEDL